MADQKDQGWFHGTKAVVGAIVAIIGVSVTVVTLLLQLGYIGGEPSILTPSKSEVTPGEQILFPGSHLEKVSSLKLLNEQYQSDNLVAFLNAGRTNLSMTIPTRVPPGRYNVELITKDGDPVRTDAYITVVLPPSPTPTVITTYTPGRPTPTSMQFTPEPDTPTPVTVLVPPPANTHTPTDVAITATSQPTPAPSPTATVTPVPAPTTWFTGAQGVYIRIVTNQKVYAGELITTEWKIVASPGTGFADYLSLYPVAAQDTDFVATRPTGGKRDGSLSFIAPDTPGKYEVRYFNFQNYEMAVSEVVDVVFP